MSTDPAAPSSLLPGVPHKRIGAPPANVNTVPRFAFRLIVINPLNGLLALSHPWDPAPKYRLPGGFIPALPHMLSAAALHSATRHELQWETGGRVVLASEKPVGTTEEWQWVDEVGVRQITVCWAAVLESESESDRAEGVTDKMLDGKWKLKWIGITEAPEVLRREEPDTEVGKGVRERDAWFLEVGLGGTGGGR